MPIGVIVNSMSVLLGGILGTFAGKWMPDRLKSELTVVLGICSVGMGISSIAGMKNMPAVVFAVVLGTAVGLIASLGKWIQKGAGKLQQPIAKHFPKQNGNLTQEEFLSCLVTAIVLFCSSGTGIYGSLDAGMTGNHTVLITKSILDLVTAAIFACNIGFVVSVIAIPQFCIFLALFFAAKLILPLTNPNMIADFRACGGFLMIATGIRIAKIKELPIADMIPSLILVMPISWIWEHVILPFVG